MRSNQFTITTLRAIKSALEQNGFTKVLSCATDVGVKTGEYGSLFIRDAPDGARERVWVNVDSAEALCEKYDIKF